MGSMKGFDEDQDFQELVRAIHDPFQNHPALKREFHTSITDSPGSYENAILNAATSVSKVVDGDGVGGVEFIYKFEEMRGRIYLLTPDDPFLASGDVIAGNFGDPTFRNLDKANPDSIITELEETYQDILTDYTTEYLRPRKTGEVHENGNEFGSVFSIQIPPDYEIEEVERTAEAIVDASQELDDLADHLIQAMQDFRNG